MYGGLRRITGLYLIFMVDIVDITNGIYSRMIHGLWRIEPTINRRFNGWIMEIQWIQVESYGTCWVWCPNYGANLLFPGPPTSRMAPGDSQNHRKPGRGRCSQQFFGNIRCLHRANSLAVNRFFCSFQFFGDQQIVFRLKMAMFLLINPIEPPMAPHGACHCGNCQEKVTWR